MRLTPTKLRLTELLLLVAGVLCVGLAATHAVEAASAQRAAAGIGTAPPSQEQQAPIHVDPNAGSVEPAAGSTKPGEVMGRLDIPALAIRVPILSDYETASLLKGIGHIPGTALPGGLGTLGLAGHRDTYFRPLRNIKPKMDIQVADGTGRYHYQVDSTEIVTPEQVEVLAIGQRPGLTLITCYPFYYVGSAPKRFIVHAHLVSALADVD